MSEKTCCGDCYGCIPITKGEARVVMGHLKLPTKLKRYWGEVMRLVVFAFKQCGICAYHCEVVSLDGITCDEFLQKEENDE